MYIFKVSPNDFLISLVAAVMTPFWSLILSIVIFLFLLVSLAKGLSVLLSFQRTKYLYF